MSQPPIGIFDSGVGGLSVLRALRMRRPDRDIVYVGDTANVPYGDKPLPVVRDLALALTGWLERRGCRTIVMASGTSTAAGLDCARAVFPTLDIHGTIASGARAAVAATGGPIGVIATNATTSSLAFTHAVQALDPGRTVIEQGCPRFVPLVETGRFDTPEARDAAAEYLPALLDSGVAAIILGCTHFPFMLAALGEVVTQSSPRVRPLFVDPAAELALEIGAAAGRDGAAPSGPGGVHFACTGNAAHFRRMASLLVGDDIGEVEALGASDWAASTLSAVPAG
jgi:glutamate racemase